MNIRIHRTLAILAIILFCLTPLSGREEKIEIVSVFKTAGIESGLGRLGLDCLAEKGGRIYIAAQEADLVRLRSAGIPFVVETQRFAPAVPGTIHKEGGINGAFHSAKELETDLRALEEAHPQIVRLFTAGTSLENRNITAVKISDNAGLDEDEAGVLFLGCHHAREWISVEVPYLLARYLAENYDLDPAVRALVDRCEIWIIPLVNPDGLEYSINSYRYWRKNRRANADGSFGVDLNRNYGFMWGVDDQGSSPEAGSAVYRGLSAFSEPETLAVRNLFLQKDFQAVISYHSFSQVILYPWGYSDLPTGNDDLLLDLAGQMSGLIAGINGRSYPYGRAASSLYTTNGDLTDWTFAMTGIPSFTIELPPVDIFSGGFFNSESEIEVIFRENLPAMLFLAGYAARTHAASAGRRSPRERIRRPLTNPRIQDK